jgi:hypothetical protein
LVEAGLVLALQPQQTQVLIPPHAPRPTAAVVAIISLQFFVLFPHWHLLFHDAWHVTCVQDGGGVLTPAACMAAPLLKVRTQSPANATSP